MIRVGRRVHLKQRQRGYDEATMVESFVMLNALGGEYVDDFAHLRADAGLKELLGHELPSPEAGCDDCWVRLNTAGAQGSGAAEKALSNDTRYASSSELTSFYSIQ